MARHVPELDLRSWGGSTTNTIADRMNTVPGFKTSAAFFTFLRANLVLPTTSTLNSNTSTPLLHPYSSQTLPPLHTLPPSSLSTMSSPPTLSVPTTSSPATPNPLDDIPPLTTQILTSNDDKIAALKLIADSIAQQRQLASRAIIFHPLTMALYIGLLGIISQFLYKTRGDTGVVLTTCAGVTMACLIAIRGATGGYLTLAEELKWSFLQGEDREEDLVLGSKFGDEIIGTVVLRLERNPPSPSSKRKGSGKNGGKHSGGKGIVRAWTVRMKYRGKGVGTELLEEAVKITRRELGGSAEIGFAKEHANSGRVIPEIFNGSFRKKEKKAAKLLEGVVERMEGKKKR